MRGSPPSPTRLLVWCSYVLLLTAVQAVNWGLPSGPRLIEEVRNGLTPWSARWGLAMATIDNPPLTDEVVQTEEEKSALFVLGGDDYIDNVGGGFLHNDVYRTTGPAWVTVTSDIHFTIWGDPLPSLVSRLNWTLQAADNMPADHEPYRVWICCEAQRGKFWSCPSDIDCTDPRHVQWSPRRHHAALSFNKRLYVLGGRARAGEDIPPNEAIGSIVGPRVDVRERSILMSDVWVSDNGKLWTMLNPGCYVHQANLMYKGKADAYTQMCIVDGDCRSRMLGNTRCIAGRCVCQTWSPRERHAVAVYSGKMFVFGGQTWIDHRLCGPIACGGEDYTAWLNDIWWSSDGIKWNLATTNAAWPARSDHKVVIAAGQFWLFGGRSGSVDVVKDNTFYNDIWSSSDGVTWEYNSTAPFSPRSSFAMSAVRNVIVVAGGQMRVPDPPPPPKLLPVEEVSNAAAVAPASTTSQSAGSGETTEETPNLPHDEVTNHNLIDILDEVWAWDLNQPFSEWQQDFANGTDQMWFLRPSSPLRLLQFLDISLIPILEANGINSIESLANAPMETVLSLKGGDLPDICQLKVDAEYILEKCQAYVQPYDGQASMEMAIIQGNSAASAYSLAQQGYDDENQPAIVDTDGCGVEKAGGLPPIEDNVDIICRYSPGAGRDWDSSVLNNQMFLGGGYISKGVYSDKLWYRDPVTPTASLVVKPGDASSDTLIIFSCDKPVTLFEYRIVDASSGAEVRNWTLSLKTVDFVEWMPGGYLKLQVRCVDPAGNRDLEFIEGVNQYSWEYIPALPWGMIIGLMLAFLAICGAVYYEWRRRRRKAAMERYAMKRMRRKFKGIQKDMDADVDWRQFYNDDSMTEEQKKQAAEMRAELARVQAAGKAIKSKKTKKGENGKGKGKGKDKGKEKKGKEKKGKQNKKNKGEGGGESKKGKGKAKAKGKKKK